MEPKQAEAAAEAVLAPHRKEQEVRAEEYAARIAHEAANKRAARWGLLGAFLGAAAGHFLADRWFIGWVVGFGAGAVIGRWVLGRRA